MNKLQALLRQQLIALSRIDMVEYNQTVFHYETPPHMKFVVEDGLMDLDKRRIAIILPFKHAKSPIVSVVYPSWRLGQDTRLHFIFTSNSRPSATTFSKSVRDLIENSEEYREVFPTTIPNIKRGWQEDSWFVQREAVSDSNPTFRALGYTGSIMGRGADELIFDDLNDQENTATDHQATKVNDWANRSIRSRRLHEDTREIVVCTRWHKYDFVSEMMKPENKYWVYHMEAISPTNEVYCHRRDPEGNWEDILIHDRGPALWPERWSLDYLRGEEIIHGPSVFSLMYQGKLIEGEEGWVTENQFTYIDEPAEDYKTIIQVWDTGLGKKTRRGSYTAMVEIGVTENGFIDLLRVIRKRMNAPDINDSILAEYERGGVDKVGIEEAAAGVSSIAYFRKTHPGVPIVAIKADKSKLARATILEVYYSNRQIRHLSNMKNRVEYEKELLTFMNSEHNDMVDAMAHAVTMVAKKMRLHKRTFMALTGDNKPELAKGSTEADETNEAVAPRRKRALAFRA